VILDGSLPWLVRRSGDQRLETSCKGEEKATLLSLTLSSDRVGLGVTSWPETSAENSATFRHENIKDSGDPFSPIVCLGLRPARCLSGGNSDDHQHPD